MIDHILEHLDLADGYMVNAVRIAALNIDSRHSRRIIHRCREAAGRERAEAFAHAKTFNIPDLLVRAELATWRRLRQYSLDRPEALSVADRRWLRVVFRHGRPGSRNVRRAAELSLLVSQSLDGGYQNPPESSRAESHQRCVTAPV